MRKIHVLSDAQPSKPSTPRSTAIQVSCTASSAAARVGTYAIATRIIARLWRSTSVANASASPRPRACVSRLSSSIGLHAETGEAHEAHRTS
jgi:hypothetical protein